MPDQANPLPHLPLPLRLQEDVTKRQPRRPPKPETKANLENRHTHAMALGTMAQNTISVWSTRREERLHENLPIVPSGVALMLKIEEGADLDFLRASFGFELVSEEDDGYVIVTTEDVDLSRFLAKVTAFAAGQGNTTAKVYEITDDSERLQRILSEHLYEIWPTIADDQIYTVEVGISCITSIGRGKGYAQEAPRFN